MCKANMVIALVALGSLAACGQQKTAYPSPPGYVFSKPQVFPMPDALQEISGIDFKDGDPAVLYAEQDEQGKVYILRGDFREAAQVRFGDKGDYEDIAILGKYVVVLRSDGTLYSFPFGELATRKVTDVRKWKDLLPKGEYESLYADMAAGRLYLLAKEADDDDPKGAVPGYVLRVADDGSISRESRFQLSEKPLTRYAGMHHKRFKPSALARNPRTKDWYVLSSVNKMLVVADSRWQVRKVYPLNPDLFIQPEGMVFDRDGALYISNEGDKTSPGTVLSFSLQPGEAEGR